MKSKRLTILCMTMIALAATPRAWQEASKLLAFAQYKAQVKFWSMVLKPKDRGESADAELIAAAQPSETRTTELASGCALEKARARETQVAGSSKAVRKTDSAPSRPKARAQRQIYGTPAAHAGLIAGAFKTQDEDGDAAALPRPEFGKSDNLRFVLPPTTTKAVAAALAEKETIVEFKLLKKTLEENKAIRQKSRLLKLRNADFGSRI